MSSKGSHVKFAKKTSQGTYTAVVPHHREVPAGTLRSILRQAGIDPDEFEEWVSLNISSTVCGIVYSPRHQQTAITFAQLPTKSERVWLKIRWA